jgi:hypothetical protein
VGLEDLVYSKMPSAYGLVQSSTSEEGHYPGTHLMSGDLLINILFYLL